jgi:hypothetical protein
MGVPAGGVWFEPQWKMRVATAWTRGPVPPWDGGSVEPLLVSTIVIISPVVRDLTW